MLKFIKRLFFLCFILLLSVWFWGSKNGITEDNYLEFIKEKIANYQQKEKSTKNKDNPGSRKKTSKTKSNKRTKGSLPNELQPLPINPFASIDRHSRNAPSSATTSIQNLANYLQQKAVTDLEKARAIYIWITDNIRYDDNSFNKGTYPNGNADYVLTNRTAVCNGYSNLFLALGTEMGIEVKKISGYSKGYRYKKGKRFYKTDHAWNIVKINGGWKIFDSTWGTGYGEDVNGKLISSKKFNDYWFNVDPFEAIFNHFPKEREQSFVQPLISLRQYEQLPKLGKSYFELGFDGKETFLMVNANPNLVFPKYYNSKTPVQLISAPIFKHLKRNDSYYFEFYIPRGLRVAVITERNDWIYFERKDGKFTLDFSPKEIGKLKISVQHEKSGESFQSILVYDVIDNKKAI